MTTRYIKVTPEQVEAARIHVQAYQNAGLEPDPVVAKMADAKRRRLESAQRRHAAADAKLGQEAKRADAANRIAAQKAEQEAGASRRTVRDAASGRFSRSVEQAARGAKVAAQRDAAEAEHEAAIGNALAITPMSDAARELALEELKFHHERQAAGSDAVTNIIHNIFFLIGAGAIAATQVPEAVVVVPLVWAAWLLHSFQRGRDTLKHQIYARALEARLNASLEPAGHGLLLWSRVLTTGSPPFVTTANFLYWLLVNLLAWVVATVVLFREGWTWFAVALIALGVAVYAACLQAILTNARFEREQLAKIKYEWSIGSVDAFNMGANRYRPRRAERAPVAKAPTTAARIAVRARG